MPTAFSQFTKPPKPSKPVAAAALAPAPKAAPEPPALDLPGKLQPNDFRAGHAGRRTVRDLPPPKKGTP